MIGRGSDSDLPMTSREECNPTKRSFPTYAEWLLWEATASPRTSHPPPKEESDFDDELLKQVETFNGEEEEEEDDEVMEEIEHYQDGDSDSQ